MWFFNYLFGILFGDQKSQAGSSLQMGAGTGIVLGTLDVLSLTTAQVAALTTTEITSLTTAQIVALSTAQTAALSTQSIVALSTEQVAAFETVDLAAMTTAQIRALTTVDIQALTSDQVVALTTRQAVALSTSAVAALTTAQIVSLETRDLAALTTVQVVAITTRDIAAFTSDQVLALTSAQSAALTTAQAAVLPVVPFSIPLLSTAQIAALTAAQIISLTTDQIVSLSTAQTMALTTAAVIQLNTTQVAAFETQDLHVLTTAQIHALTSAQTQVFNTGQTCAFTSDQIPAFTTTAWAELLPVTPIILDLNGDGVRTLSIADGVKFDIFGDGQAVNTGWVSGGDGLLVLDRNHDGAINDGSELFGSSTKLANGERASDGYAALRELDTNSDGVISSADAAYADLRIWVDSNSDGISETGETKTLESLGIASINVNATVGANTDNGNILGLTSTYQTTDGQTHAAADVWFIADKGGVNASAGTLDAAIAALNITNAPTVAPSSGDIASQELLEPMQLAEAAPVEVNDDLRKRVSSLAQAMGAFSEGAGAIDTLAAPNLNVAGTVPPTNGGAGLAVGGMVDVMKQFDSNGNQVLASVETAVSSSQSLAKPNLQSGATQGYLVVTES